VLTIVTALLWLGAALGLPETLPAARRNAGSLAGTLNIFGQLIRDTPFVGYAVAAGLAFGAMFAYIAGSPFVLQGIFHVSPQTFSLIFGVNALGFVVTSQINGSLVSRIRPARLLTGGLVANATAGLALLFVVVSGFGLLAVLLPLFLLASSVGFIVPNATALALSRRPDAAGTGSALLGVIQSGVAALGAPAAARRLVHRQSGSLRKSGRGTCRSTVITQRSAGGTHTISEPRSRPRTIASATASGVVASGAGSRPSVIFVCTKPGRTIITDAPVPTSASPRPWKNASRPAFVDP